MTRRNDIDYFTYTKLDPEDDEVFFGPITRRELLRSVEVEEEIVRRRRANKKAEAAKKTIFEAEDELNKTLKIAVPINNEKDNPEVSTGKQRMLNDVTQSQTNERDAAKLVKKNSTLKKSTSHSSSLKKARVPESPVAAYIHKGLEIRSASKLRHGLCISKFNDPQASSRNRRSVSSSTRERRPLSSSRERGRELPSRERRSQSCSSRPRV